MFRLFDRYYIRSSKGNCAVPLYVASFDVMYDDVSWTTYRSNAFYTDSFGEAVGACVGLRENEFHVQIVRRWWWFGWHEEVERI